MNTYKKLIFLNNAEKNNIATLTIEKKHNGSFGCIKSFNNLKGDYLLGFISNNKIYKQNINFKEQSYTFVLPNDFKIEEEINCVLCENINSSLTPILWGSEKNKTKKMEIVANLKNNFAKLQTLNNQAQHSKEKSVEQPSVPKNSPPLQKQTHENIEKNVTQFTNENIKIESVGYAFAPYKQAEKNTDNYDQISMEEEIINNDSAYATNYQLFENTTEEIEDIIDSEMSRTTDHEFYNMIADQLKELFERYPQEANLEKLIENSKWCKIYKEIDNNYYVVGIIYKDDDIKYIAYGVPGSYNVEPPREMRDYSQWLPTDITDPYTNGYWVMYQDADTGENIFLN